MSILIDTNILLRSVQPSNPMHPSAVRALEILMEREEALVVTLQNVVEFWNVATRPIVNNGLGFTIEEAREEIVKIEGFFKVLYENEASYAAWKTLVITNRVNGVQVHDARLAAVMTTYGVSQIVTFNVKDFTRFSGIEMVHPDDVKV
jgi:predicted nucleic acid-binding protein